MSDNGKIIGIGFDMVKVARIESVLSRWGSRFEKRVFTELEITYCNNRKTVSRGWHVGSQQRKPYSKLWELAGEAALDGRK